MLPPLCVIKGKTVKTLQSLRTQDAPVNTKFSVSDSGWTKMGIMERWFKDHFLPLIGPQRPQLLLMDGHNSHNYVELLTEARDNNVIIVELPEHTSHWLQPLDRTVFGPFKKAYNKACTNLMNDNPGTVVSKVTFCGLMQKAWTEGMTEGNLKSGFKAYDVYPLNPGVIPQDAYQPNSATRMEKVSVHGVPQEIQATIAHQETPATGVPPETPVTGVPPETPATVVPQETLVTVVPQETPAIGVLQETPTTVVPQETLVTIKLIRH
ncbi:uncharacterized protein LOC117316310 [Pecten maximus]|uniref:uncharacterized protein LOC117316310 n=1 Tax=Pecten maximus TaxID=6579 RepID=UPI0014590AA9|nr:uncharacterized protein LOC117316310 [Pecten maximus]